MRDGARSSRGSISSSRSLAIKVSNNVTPQNAVGDQTIVFGASQRSRSSMRWNLLDSHVSHQSVGTKVPGLLDTRILSIPTIKSFRHARKTLARRIAHSFQKNKTQKLFVVVAIDIGDISFFFLGLLLTLRYGYHLFGINGFNERLKGVFGFVSVEFSASEHKNCKIGGGVIGRILIVSLSITGGVRQIHTGPLISCLLIVALGCLFEREISSREDQIRKMIHMMWSANRKIRMKSPG